MKLEGSETRKRIMVTGGFWLVAIILAIITEILFWSGFGFVTLLTGIFGVCFLVFGFISALTRTTDWTIFDE